MSRNLRCCVFAAAMATLTVFAAWCQENSGSVSGIGPDFGVVSLGRFRLQLYGGLKGFEIVPGVDGRILAIAGGGYVNDAYYRDLSGAEIVYSPATASAIADASFWRWFVQGKFGLDLGLIHDNHLGKNTLYALFLAKTYYSSFFSSTAPNAIIFTTNYPDKDGFWESSLYAGIYLDLVRFNTPMQTYHGFAAEISADWAPESGINKVRGDADYLRLNATTRGYWTLFETNALGFYVADRTIADILLGPKPSLYAKRTIGGFDAYPGAGGAVRGYEESRYDSLVKLVNNFDARLTALPLFGGRVIPEAYVFFDLGLVGEPDYRLWTDHILSSTGGGVFLNLNLGPVQFDIGYYLCYAFMENRWNFVNITVGVHQF